MYNQYEQEAIATQVLRDRLLANFLDYARYFFMVQYGIPFIVGEHHKRIANKLMDVYEGRCTRLIINIPPRYGKTELVVKAFIAWSMTKNPWSKFIHLSYSNDLVLDNSKAVLSLLQSPEHQILFPMKFKAEAVNKWFNSSHGGMYSVSTGGQVTGFGAGSISRTDFSGAIIIDDPMKPDDATSDVLRNGINSLINSTIRSRTNSRLTPIILIMQRLHDDDTTGFLLSGADKDEWEVLCMPAYDTIRNEALWPAKHTVEELLKLQAIDKYVFASQYQQDPVPDDGEAFKNSGLSWYQTAPKNLRYYGASDYAVTSGGGDWTEHGVFGVDSDDNVFIVDWWSGQESSDVWIDKQIEMMKRWNVDFWAGESGPIRRSVEPFLMREMDRKKCYVTLEWVPHTGGDKMAKAQSFIGMWNMNKVRLPLGAEWATKLLAQMMRFPSGKNDDKVDVLGIFGRCLHKVRGGKLAEKSGNVYMPHRFRQVANGWLGN